MSSSGGSFRLMHHFRMFLCILLAFMLSNCAVVSNSPDSFIEVARHKKNSEDVISRQTDKEGEFAVFDKNGRLMWSRILKKGDTYGFSRSYQYSSYQPTRAVVIHLGGDDQVEDDDYTIKYNNH